MAKRSLRAMWIVWNPASSMPPRVRHRTEEEAKQAAKVMAKRHPGNVFFVLEAKSQHHCAPIKSITERECTRCGEPRTDDTPDERIRVLIQEIQETKEKKLDAS